MLKHIFSLRWIQAVFVAGAATGATIGTVAGIGVGMAVGMLLAPKSGKQLRDEITDRTSDLVDQVRMHGTELVTQVRNSSGDLRGKAEKFMSPINGSRN